MSKLEITYYFILNILRYFENKKLHNSAAAGKIFFETRYIMLKRLYKL